MILPILATSLLPISEWHFIDLPQYAQTLSDDYFESSHFDSLQEPSFGEKIFSAEEFFEMRSKFWHLGREKWKEAIDGIFHQHGRFVFDLGLHEGKVEPGFLESWEKANIFISRHLDEKLSLDLYLKTHELLTEHFSKKVGTLCDASEGGTFRDGKLPLFWTISPRTYYYDRLKGLRSLLSEMNPCPATLSEPEENGNLILYYHSFSADQIKEMMEKILMELHDDLSQSSSEEDLLFSIAKFRRHAGWIHPVTDGSGRLNTLIMNFLLTQYGFHPVILPLPYLFDLSSLEDCVKLLKEGLKLWEAR